MNKNMQDPDFEIMDVIFPFKVYRDYGVATPDGGAPLMTIEAGFRTQEDAKIYIKAKSAETNEKYVIKSVLAEEK